MAHREFLVVTPEVEPHSFTLRGKRQSSGADWEETFTCWGRIAPAALVDLALAMKVTPDGKREWSSAAVISFIRRALMDPPAADTNGDTDPETERAMTQKAMTQKARWAVLTNDSDRPLDIQEDLGPILMWLAEEYTGRPTQPPST